MRNLTEKARRELTVTGPTRFEHPRSNDLVDLLATDPSSEELSLLLGPPLREDFVAVLIASGILTQAAGDRPKPESTRSVRLTSLGLWFPGIARPAAWLAKTVVPVLGSRPGQVGLLVTVAAGLASFLSGRPDLPRVSSTPALEAVLLILLGLLISAAHELAHAVALVRYGGVPTTAGVGYTGASLSFFVDSTPALSLGRRPQVAREGPVEVGEPVHVIALMRAATSSTAAPTWAPL